MLLYYTKIDSYGKKAPTQKEIGHATFITDGYGEYVKESMSKKSVQPPENKNTININHKLIEKCRSDCCAEHPVLPKLPDSVIIKRIQLRSNS